jgi:ubiquinone/menaquinone biosynthesis C-methylase UbiE
VKANPNTPNLWNSLLFEENRTLLSSDVYKDKLKKVTAFLKGKKGKILDIGFGMGNLEKILISRDTSLKLYGLDISDKAVNHIKKLYRGDFRVGEAQHLPFQDSHIDIVVMLDVYEHIYEDSSKLVLSEVRRVLRKGGDFIISVPLNENLKWLNGSGKNHNRHVREFTHRSIKKEIESAGFEITKTELLYAFHNHYRLKSLVVRIFPKLKNPNLITVYALKK